MEALPRGTTFLVGLATLAVALFAVAARADAIIVWADAGTESQPDTLASAHRDGSGLDEFYVNTRAARNSVLGVAVGANHVYWADRTGYIGRASLDGTNVEPHFITTNGGRPLDVALGNGAIYWTNARGGTIGRANRDGTNVDQFFIFTQYNAATGGGAAGLAVDDNYVYWVNNKGGGANRTASIGRAPISNPTAAKQNFIPGLTAANDVAVNGSKVFWTQTTGVNGVGSIGDAFLNGTGADPEYIPLGANYQPLGITLGSNHIYWASPSGEGSSIGRAALDGTDPQKSFITGTSPNWGIAITPKPASTRRR
jgi:hypothetical protein